MLNRTWKLVALFGALALAVPGASAQDENGNNTEKVKVVVVNEGAAGQGQTKVIRRGGKATPGRRHYEWTKNLSG